MTRKMPRGIAVAALLFVTLAVLSPRVQSGREAPPEACEGGCSFMKKNCFEVCETDCAILFDPQDPETRSDFLDCRKRCRAVCLEQERTCKAMCKVDEPPQSPL